MSMSSDRGSLKALFTRDPQDLSEPGINPIDEAYQAGVEHERKVSARAIRMSMEVSRDSHAIWAAIAAALLLAVLVIEASGGMLRLPEASWAAMRAWIDSYEFRLAARYAAFGACGALCLHHAWKVTRRNRQIRRLKANGS